MKPGASHRELVLVVDHDELVRWCAAEGLKEYGYAVVVAADAHEALQRDPNAAVALLDHDLRGADGLDAADTLHHLQPRCAIVLMTADLTPELTRRARERGVVGILEKPFSLETLVATVDEALDPSAGLEGRGRDRTRETAAPQEV